MYNEIEKIKTIQDAINLQEIIKDKAYEERYVNVEPNIIRVYAGKILEILKDKKAEEIENDIRTLKENVPDFIFMMLSNT